MTTVLIGPQINHTKFNESHLFEAQVPGKHEPLTVRAHLLRRTLSCILSAHYLLLKVATVTDLLSSEGIEKSWFPITVQCLSEKLVLLSPSA